MRRRSPIVRGFAIRTVAGAFALLAATGAAAQDARLERALAIYAAGDFAGAARLAGQLKTSAGLTLAARATLARAAYKAPPDARRRLFHHAETLARAALQRDGENAHTLRLLVIALGYIARGTEPVSAFFKGYASEAKVLIARARSVEPDSPWVHSLIGAWHAEIVHAAGKPLAMTLYGASVKDARAAYERALSLAPANPVIRFEYAKALLQMLGAKAEAQARRHLAVAARAVPRDAFERLVSEKARHALGALKAGDGKTLNRILDIDAKP